MTMRVPTLAVASLLALSPVSPVMGLNACVFRTAPSTADLSETAGQAANPYSGDFSRNFSALFEDDGDCGTVYVEHDALILLQAGGNTIPVSLSTTNAASVSGSSLRELDDRQAGINFRADVGFDDNGIPRSGIYTATLTVRIFDRPNGGSLIDSIDYSVQLDVAQVMTLSLNGTGLSGNSEVDLGVFEEGQSRTIDPGLNLTAVSNDPYKIEVTSEKGWNIVHTDDDAYAIPYQMFIEGQGASKSFTENSATVGTGKNRGLTFTATPHQGRNLRAGRYEDEVTIIITGQ